MKKSYWVVLSIVIILLLGLYWFWNSGSNDKSVHFETVPIERGDIEMIISASGTLNATNTVEVGTQVSGVINKVLVDFNDLVKKGQVIAQIDTRHLQSTLDQMEASVMQAEVQVAQKRRVYESTQKFNHTAEKDITVLEAESALAQVKSQMELAKSNYSRFEKLYKSDAISQTEYETRKSEYERLQANYASASAALSRTQANASNVDIQKTLDDLKTAKANLASAKANRQKAKINLDYAIVRAPIDGIVISRNIEVGQTVAASFQTPVLFTIANDLTKMEIEASIDEADIGLIQQAQSVTFSVDAYPDISFNGRVEQIRLQPQVISNVVTYIVIVNAGNDDLKLMPGMTANLDILAAQRKEVLKVPVTALNFTPPLEYRDPWKNYLEEEVVAIKISQDGWKTGVLWKVEDNKLVPKKVKYGLSDGLFTEIKSADFSEGDLVVTGINDDSSKSNDKTTSNPFLPSRPGSKKTNSETE